MPRSGWAREPQLLSLRVWSLCSAGRGRDGERPAHHDEEWSPLAAAGESPRTEAKTQHSHKKKKTQISPRKDLIKGVIFLSQVFCSLILGNWVSISPEVLRLSPLAMSWEMGDWLHYPSKLMPEYWKERKRKRVFHIWLNYEVLIWHLSSGRRKLCWCQLLLFLINLILRFQASVKFLESEGAFLYGEM